MICARFQRPRRIDILVNNAGRVARKRRWLFCVEEWQAVLDVNLTSDVPVLTNRAYLYIKKRGGGAIVNVAVLYGLWRSVSDRVLSGVEGGVVNLNRALALEWAADGIRVNAVAPRSLIRDDDGDFFEPRFAEQRDADNAARAFAGYR